MLICNYTATRTPQNEVQMIFIVLVLFPNMLRAFAKNADVIFM